MKNGKYKLHFIKFIAHLPAQGTPRDEKKPQMHTYEHKHADTK